MHPDFLKSFQVRTYLRNVGLADVWQWLGFRRLADAQKLNDTYTAKLVEHVNSSSIDNAILSSGYAVINQRTPVSVL